MHCHGPGRDILRFCTVFLRRFERLKQCLKFFQRCVKISAGLIIVANVAIAKGPALLGSRGLL